MFILDSAKKTIHDSSYLQRITLSVKSDAVLICGAVTSDTPLMTLGKYANEKEARAVFLDLFGELSRGADFYEMPDSELFHRERDVRDARIRRRGGS